MRMDTEGNIKMPISEWLYDKYQQNVPAYQRLYLESLGKAVTDNTNQPITAADFTPEELQHFKNLLDLHKENPDNKLGTKHVVSDYNEYQSLLDRMKPQTDEAAEVYARDLPQRLGRFGFTDQPAGGYQIYDTYEFSNPQRTMPPQSISDLIPEMYQRYKKSGTHGLAGALGEYIMQGKGVPVQIDIPSQQDLTAMLRRR